MVHEIHTYADLRKQIHDDLRMQHPEWIQPNGESPMCDSYEARLMETLDVLMKATPEYLLRLRSPKVRRLRTPRQEASAVQKGRHCGIGKPCPI